MPVDDAQGPVLLCWDGSASAGSAIAHAARILGAGRRAIVLFAHVPTEEHGGVLGGTSGPDAPIVGLADAQDALEEGVRVAREAGFDASGQRIVADRKTAEIIVATAEEHVSPLIVMGQRGRSGLKAALLGLGSVAQGVLSSYGGPVMLVGRDAAPPQPPAD
jgi:nucleotide-binding universal stress UspA family protein